MKYIVTLHGTNNVIQTHGFDGMWITLDLKTYMIAGPVNLHVTTVTLAGVDAALIKIYKVGQNATSYSPTCCFTPVSIKAKSLIILEPDEYDIEVVKIGRDLTEVSCQQH